MASIVRPKVLVTHRQFPEVGLKILRQKCEVFFCDDPPTRQDILGKSKGMDGILWATHSPLNAEALDAAGPQLRSVSTMSSGLDYIDVAEVKRRNIALGYTPLVLNDAVADIAVGLLIAAGRRFHEGRRKIETSTWEKSPLWMVGTDICGSTVGFVGFGGIGQKILKRLRGFEVAEFLYTGHRAKPEGDQLGAKFVQLPELLKRSDFVVLACPLTTETHGLFNMDKFRQMKPTSVLVNIARGEIVDQDALVTALRDKVIFSAGLDVMYPEPLASDHPLMSMPNAIIIPHLGAATTRTREDMATLTAENILLGLAGKPMLTPVT